MDWKVKFETNLFKIYYRQDSIFTSEPVELGSSIDRLEKGEHVVSIVPNVGATETGLLPTRASVINGLAVIARMS